MQWLSRWLQILKDSKEVNSKQWTQVDEGKESSGAPSTRLITGNPALDGAVVGVGVGIIGFNKQLDHQ